MYSLDGFSVDLVKSVHGHSRFYPVKAFGKAVDPLANIGGRVQYSSLFKKTEFTFGPSQLDC